MEFVNTSIDTVIYHVKYKNKKTQVVKKVERGNIKKHRYYLKRYMNIGQMNSELASNKGRTNLYMGMRNMFKM